MEDLALYGVTGWPLGQSLSPLLHNTGFQALRLPAAYARWEVPPEKLPAFVESVRLLHIRGCSVTIPHKVALTPLLDAVSPLARQVGAVNTLYWQDDTLCGHNTDVAGFLAPLAGLPLDRGDALLLGAGGAARAVAAGLTGLPQDKRPRRIYVATPSNRSHLPLAQTFGLTPLPWEERHSVPALLVVNTTPLGMCGKAGTATPYDFAQAPLPHCQQDDFFDGTAAQATPLAYDLVYNPLETRFLREARLAGRRGISGLEMFYGQGDAQFRLWTGRALPPQARQALDAALKVKEIPCV